MSKNKVHQTSVAIFSDTRDRIKALRKPKERGNGFESYESVIMRAIDLLEKKEKKRKAKK